MATLLQTSTVSMPSRCAVAKVAAARRRLSANVGFVDALEVAQRLVEIEGQAEATGQRADLLRGVVTGDQIGLEDLDAVEAGGGAGVQLLHQ